MQYILFRLGEMFDGKLFIALVGLVLIIGAAIFFTYDYKTEGPVLANGLGNRNLNVSKHAKKNSKKVEIRLAIAPIVVLVLLFAIKSSLSHIPSPDTIVPNKEEKNVVKGKVMWLHNSTGKVAITTNDRKEDNPIVARVNNVPVSPDAPLISAYAGTGISNQQFLTLNVGDNVKINVHPYKWKYKNHGDFGDDKHAEYVKNMLNLAKVNGEVNKSKSDSAKKKTTDVNKSQILTNPNALE